MSGVMRKWLLAIFGLSLLPMLFVVVWLAQSADPINAANFERIEVGMTEQQVEEILGGPASGEFPADVLASVVPYAVPRSEWNGRGHRMITVVFHMENGQRVVEFKQFFNPSVWDRLNAWWGGYELDPHPIVGKVKRLESGA